MLPSRVRNVENHTIGRSSGDRDLEIHHFLMLPYALPVSFDFDSAL